MVKVWLRHYASLAPVEYPEANGVYSNEEALLIMDRTLEDPVVAGHTWDNVQKFIVERSPEELAELREQRKLSKANEARETAPPGLIDLIRQVIKAEKELEPDPPH